MQTRGKVRSSALEWKLTQVAIRIGRTSSVSTFTGSITTTGKSEAIRLDKALFRLHPEFRQKAKVRVQVIAPGHALISVLEEGAPAITQRQNFSSACWT